MNMTVLLKFIDQYVNKIISGDTVYKKLDELIIIFTILIISPAIACISSDVIKIHTGFKIFPTLCT